MARLGDVCEILNGYAFRSENYTDTGVRIIRISNVQKGYIEDNTPVFYPFNDINVEKYKLFEGDVLLSLTGNVGRVGLLEKKFLPAALNQRVACIRIKDDTTLDKSFLFNLLNSDSFEQKCILSSKGVAQKNMSTEWLKDYKISLPPLDEQRKIAAVLDKVSDLIAKRRQQLDKLDELIKARFVEMFGDPVSNPKGWQLVPLGECVTTIDNGKSFVCSNETRKNEWPAILKLSAVTYGEYNSNENKALLDSSQFIENAEVHSGDLLFTRKNTPELVGMAAYVYSSPAKLMMPDLIFRLNTKDNCSKIFLWQLINHELFRKNIQNIASGSAKSMSNISKERLMQLVIYLPPIKLQNHFAAFVEQTEKTKTTISKSLEKLETLKKALMQEYFG